MKPTLQYREICQVWIGLDRYSNSCALLSHSRQWQTLIFFFKASCSKSSARNMFFKHKHVYVLEIWWRQLLSQLGRHCRLKIEDQRIAQREAPLDHYSPGNRLCPWLAWQRLRLLKPCMEHVCRKWWLAKPLNKLKVMPYIEKCCPPSSLWTSDLLTFDHHIGEHDMCSCTFFLFLFSCPSTVVPTSASGTCMHFILHLFCAVSIVTSCSQCCAVTFFGAAHV